MADDDHFPYLGLIREMRMTRKEGSKRWHKTDIIICHLFWHGGDGHSRKLIINNGPESPASQRLNNGAET